MMKKLETWGNLFYLRECGNPLTVELNDRNVKQSFELRKVRDSYRLAYTNIRISHNRNHSGFSYIRYITTVISLKVPLEIITFVLHPHFLS